MSGPPQHVPMQMHESEYENVELSLENKDLWEQFHEHKTEMVITKAGRWVNELLTTGAVACGLDTPLEFS